MHIPANGTVGSQYAHSRKGGFAGVAYIITYTYSIATTKYDDFTLHQFNCKIPVEVFPGEQPLRILPI